MLPFNPAKYDTNRFDIKKYDLYKKWVAKGKPKTIKGIADLSSFENDCALEEVPIMRTPVRVSSNVSSLTTPESSGISMTVAPPSSDLNSTFIEDSDSSETELRTFPGLKLQGMLNFTPIKPNRQPIPVEFASTVVLPSSLTDEDQVLLSGYTLHELASILSKLYEERTNSTISITCRPKISEEVQMTEIINSWQKKRREAEGTLGNPGPSRRVMIDNYSKVITTKEFKNQRKALVEKKEKQEQLKLERQLKRSAKQKGPKQTIKKIAKPKVAKKEESSSDSSDSSGSDMEVSYDDRTDEENLEEEIEEKRRTPSKLHSKSGAVEDPCVNENVQDLFPFSDSDQDEVSFHFPSIEDGDVGRYFAVYYNKPASYYWGKLVKTFSEDPDSANESAEFQFLHKKKLSTAPSEITWEEPKVPDMSIVSAEFVFYGPEDPIETPQKTFKFAGEDDVVLRFKNLKKHKRV